MATQLQLTNISYIINIAKDIVATVTQNISDYNANCLLTRVTGERLVEVGRFLVIAMDIFWRFADRASQYNLTN